MVERRAFHTLASAIQRMGLADDWVLTDNNYRDSLPMSVFRFYIFDDYDFHSDIDQKLLDDIEEFLDSLILCPDFRPNDVNRDGDTLLHLLCKTPKASTLLKLLLSRNDVAVNIKDKYECTPLDFCLLYKNKEAEEMVRQCGGVSGDEIDEMTAKRKTSSKAHDLLEEYREAKVNNFYPKTSNIKKLLDPNILDKNWI